MRLTDKLENGNYDILEQEDVCVARPLRPERYHLMIQKLGKLEDIEDVIGISLIDYFKGISFDIERNNQYLKLEKELGIDLITLFKALKDGVYSSFVDQKGNRFILKSTNLYPSRDFDGFVCFFEGNDERVLLFKDYGKTWALTKEGLTDGK